MLLAPSAPSFWLAEHAPSVRLADGRTLALALGFGQRARVTAETRETVEAKAARGDRDALAALLKEHAPAVAQVCLYVAGPTDGPDVAQQALERIVTSISLFDPARGTFRSWALSVARNVCRDRLRRRGLERATFVDDGDDATDASPSRSHSPEDIALTRADSKKLAEAMQSLPQGSRMALVMYHLQEATYEEIATALGVPVGTVMTWLHRGRKKLRTLMESSET